VERRKQQKLKYLSAFSVSSSSSSKSNSLIEVFRGDFVVAFFKLVNKIMKKGQLCCFSLVEYSVVIEPSFGQALGIVIL
jgi:hypothetical protein